MNRPYFSSRNQRAGVCSAPKLKLYVFDHSPMFVPLSATSHPTDETDVTLGENDRFIGIRIKAGVVATLASCLFGHSP